MLQQMHTHTSAKAAQFETLCEAELIGGMEHACDLGIMPSELGSGPAGTPDAKPASDGRCQPLGGGFELQFTQSTDTLH